MPPPPYSSLIHRFDDGRSQLLAEYKILNHAPHSFTEDDQKYDLPKFDEVLWVQVTLRLLPDRTSSIFGYWSIRRHHEKWQRHMAIYSRSHPLRAFVPLFGGWPSELDITSAITNHIEQQLVPYLNAEIGNKPFQGLDVSSVKLQIAPLPHNIQGPMRL